MESVGVDEVTVAIGVVVVEVVVVIGAVDVVDEVAVAEG